MTELEEPDGGLNPKWILQPQNKHVAESGKLCLTCKFVMQQIQNVSMLV